jgi:hypothetical protein
LREIAVSGRTAHPALAAEICADLGVRRAASQASSAAAWPCCPVAAAQRATMEKWVMKWPGAAPCQYHWSAGA